MTEWLIGDLYVDLLSSTDWQDVDDDVGDQVLVMVVIAGKITVRLQGIPIPDHEVGPFVIREWSPFGFDHEVIEMVYCLVG